MRFFGKMPFLYQKLKTSRKVYVIDADISKQWNSPKMTYLNHRQTTCIVAICLTALLLSPLFFCIVILTNMRSSFNYQWTWNGLKDTESEDGKITVCPGVLRGNSSQQNFMIFLGANSTQQNIQEIQKNFPPQVDNSTGSTSNFSLPSLLYSTGGRGYCYTSEAPSGVKRCSDIKMKTVMRCLNHNFGYKPSKGKKLNPCFLIRIERSQLGTAAGENIVKAAETTACPYGNVCMGCKPQHEEDKKKFSRIRLSRSWSLVSQQNQQSQPLSFMVQVVELQPKANLTLVCWMNFFRDGAIRNRGTVTVQLVH